MLDLYVNYLKLIGLSNCQKAFGWFISDLNLIERLYYMHWSTTNETNELIA